MISGVDKFDDIYARMRELQEAAKPRCPLYDQRMLHDCLRSEAKCGDGCEFKNDWLGPQ